MRKNMRMLSVCYVAGTSLGIAYNRIRHYRTPTHRLFPGMCCR